MTRPKERAGTLSKRLRALGAKVTEFPCIETVPMVPCEPMAEAIRNIDNYQWLAFTSPAGVTTLMSYLESIGEDVRALGRIRLAAIGPGTDKVLRKHGLHADLIPEIYDGENLGKALVKAAPTGKVLILRAQWGTQALADELTAGNVAFDDVRCYETRFACPEADKVRELLSAENPPIVTFTSASTVKGFVGAMGDFDPKSLLGACIGRQTQEEAQKHGIPTVVAETATMDSLIDLIRAQL